MVGVKLDTLARPSTQVVDGLWHCLCPPTTSLRLGIFRPQLNRHIFGANRQSRVLQVRSVHLPSEETERSAFAKFNYLQTEPQEDWREQLADKRNSYGGVTHRTANQSTTFQLDSNGGRAANRQPQWLQRKTQVQRKALKELEIRETIHNAYLRTLNIDSKEVLYLELHKACDKQEYHLVHEIVKLLVQYHLEPPNERLYRSLLLANASSIDGSPEEVRQILDNIADDGVPFSSEIFHAALRALAVHPDYVLRQEIILQMESQWMKLTENGYNTLAVSLLRDRQIEQALDQLDHLHKYSHQIRPWLYNLVIYTLCSTGDFDRVLTLIDHHRPPYGNIEIFPTLYSHVVDCAAQALHHPLVEYVWYHRVREDLMNPSTGVCTHILNTASKAADFALATDVLRILGRRTTALRLHHYEPVIEAYIKAGELNSALAILPTMTAAGVPPTETTLRPFAIHMRERKDLVIQARETLQKLKISTGRDIPIAAVNALIETFVDHNDLDEAAATYHALDSFSSLPTEPVSASAKDTPNPPTDNSQPQPNLQSQPQTKPKRKPPFAPNTRTLNNLFRGCALACDKDLAMVFATEMLTQRVAPDALTYDRLIIVCVTSSSEATRERGLPERIRSRKDVEDGWRYFEEMGRMRGGAWWPRRGTVKVMVDAVGRLVGGDSGGGRLGGGSGEKGVVEGDGDGEWVMDEERMKDKAWRLVAESEERGMRGKKMDFWKKEWEESLGARERKIEGLATQFSRSNT
ncbi:hypothetical protein MMC25_002881 [Agyrium rufum]|nr:hypothetical protein [Agyrium rufum]